MYFIKQYKFLLVVNISLLVILTSLVSRNIHEKQREILAIKEAVVPEFVVPEEQQVQAKPIEPHTEDEQKIPIFVYHSVRPHEQKESRFQDLYDITPELFEQQLMYLRDNGYHVITTKDIFVDTKTGKVVTHVNKPVMLTFDDGWKNQYQYAYPLLKKYHDSAVFYVYTSTIGDPAFLTWDYVKEMRDGGMVIGSHTLTHPHLKRISDDMLKKEIFDSKKILEEKLGVTIDDFATPYGYSDDRIVSMIKEAGYRTSRTLYKGSYHKDMFTLKGYLARDDFKDFVAVLKSKD
jgi:peptidoglycan/xylan/chitin deacetylase (PgdA/CDA1 family)